MKKYSTRVILLFIICTCSFQANAQKKYWKALIPGFYAHSYHMKTDIEGGIHLSVNSGNSIDPNLFISFDKTGKVIYKEHVSEYALFSFRDSNAVQVLISFSNQTLHVRRISPLGIVLTNTLIPMPTSVSSFPSAGDFFEFITSIDLRISSNNKFWLCGAFKYDPVLGPSTNSYNLINIDYNTPSIFNIFHWPNFYNNRLRLQEDSLGNINLFDYSIISQEVTLQKISPAGNIIQSITFGDPWFVGDLSLETFKITKNYIYIGLTDINQGFRILKLNKTTLDTIFYSPIANPLFDFGDFFDASDSIYTISSGNPPNYYIRHDYFGNLICTGSAWNHAGYKFFHDGNTSHTVRDVLYDIDENCNVVQSSNIVDYNAQQLIYGFISTPNFPEDYISSNGVHYIISETVDDIFGIVAFTDSTLSNIKGRLYFDQNNNCSQDSGEIGIPNKLVSLNPNGPWLFTGDNGFFETRVDTGAYLIEADPFNSTAVFCPAGFPINIIDTTTLYSSNYIGVQDQVSNLQDLSVSIHQTATVPGQTSFVFITINNWGPIFSTGYVKLSMEPGLYNLSYSSVPPDSIVGNNYYWGLDSVGFLQSKRINLDLVTVNSATLGVPFLNKVEVFNANNEPNTLNNIGISEGVVLGSFDPNDKQVNPQGQGVNGEINPKDSILTYKIRFQNTGTYKAFNIKVVDTLDINLDISTFTLETYSHPCKVSFLSPRVIEFFFEDIMLPDSATDNRNSHGFIQYTIRTNQSLPFGTQIKNSASIYFDFNEPIYTNQTLNTITTVGLEELEYLGQFFITPNPAKERILIQFVNAEFPGVIRVIDLQGRIILEESYEKGQRQMELDIQNLSNGTYIIQNKNIYSNQSNFFIKM